MHNIIHELNVYKNDKTSLILIIINQYILIIDTYMIFPITDPLIPIPRDL